MKVEAAEEKARQAERCIHPCHTSPVFDSVTASMPWRDQGVHFDCSGWALAGAICETQWGEPSAIEETAWFMLRLSGELGRELNVGVSQQHVHSKTADLRVVAVVRLLQPSCARSAPLTIAIACV